jgi:DNA-binding MarR family transcriptional regulator
VNPRPTRSNRKPPPLPTRFAGPKESPGFLLWKVSNAWQRRQRAALQPFGLTHSQFVVLATATWFGSSERGTPEGSGLERTEPLTQARIAELSGVDAMTTSQIVRALEAGGLLERREHPGDPRAKAIVVTATGRERARKAVAVVEETDAAFFGPVASSEALLVKIFKALDRDEGSG